LKDCLVTQGEKISSDDLNSYLVALTGGDSESIADNKLFDPKGFAQHLLGFEDFNLTN